MDLFYLLDLCFYTLNIPACFRSASYDSQTGASQLMKQGHRYLIFLTASFLAGEHKSGPMMEESRLTSRRQPSITKKCSTEEEKREKETVLASKQLRAQS